MKQLHCTNSVKTIISLTQLFFPADWLDGEIPCRVYLPADDWAQALIFGLDLVLPRFPQKWDQLMGFLLFRSEKGQSY
jgi:hypothetical protein